MWRRSCFQLCRRPVQTVWSLNSIFHIVSITFGSNPLKNSCPGVNPCLKRSRSPEKIWPKGRTQTADNWHHTRPFISCFHYSRSKFGQHSSNIGRSRFAKFTISSVFIVFGEIFSAYNIKAIKITLSESFGQIPELKKSACFIHRRVFLQINCRR